MKTRHLVLFLGLSVASFSLLAQDVVPATTEDVQNFDEKVAETPDQEDPEEVTGDKVKKEKKEKKDKKEKKENFGKIVSEEAHRMKTLPKEERHKMGPWVSAQRRKDSAKKSDVSGSDSSYGGTADARSSSPHGKGAGKSNRKN